MDPAVAKITTTKGIQCGLYCVYTVLVLMILMLRVLMMNFFFQTKNKCKVDDQAVLGVYKNSMLID